jgi:hypothetical protein
VTFVNNEGLDIHLDLMNSGLDISHLILTWKDFAIGLTIVIVNIYDIHIKTRPSLKSKIAVENKYLNLQFNIIEW